MEIRTYTHDRANEVADLFHSSVHNIDPAQYSKAQKEAWAPTPPDYEKWRLRLAGKKPYLVLINEKVAGFIELDPDGHIDCAYTHPDYQGKGVAKSLYKYIESIAKDKKLARLFVDASIVAKPFFERMGFDVLRENHIERNGEVLINYTMEKRLIPRGQDSKL